MIFFSPKVYAVCMCLLKHLIKFLLVGESDLVFKRGSVFCISFTVLVMCLCWPLALVTETVIENNWSWRNLCINVFFQRNEALAGNLEVLCA